MNEYNALMSLLKDQVPFAFARFNDGEMKGVAQIGRKVARGDQIVTESLNAKLKEALRHRQKNYWIGKPCRGCFVKQRKLFDTFVSSEYPCLTHAVLLCNNGHWPKFIKDFPEYVGSA